MTVQEIATGLINLAEDFDLYDFRDRVEHPEQLQEEVTTVISEGRGIEYAPFLNDVMEESPMLRSDSGTGSISAGERSPTADQNHFYGKEKAEQEIADHGNSVDNG